MQHDRKLHDLGAGYEIAEGYRIRHTKLAKTLIDVRQGGVFYRAPDRFQATIFSDLVKQMDAGT